MKILPLMLIILGGTMINAFGESMTQDRLHGILEGLGDTVEIKGNIVNLEIDGVQMMCISDPNADRMRIISAIRSVEGLDTTMLLKAMAANFHTALDARYAISGDTVYAAFIHPLSPLTVDQVKSAVKQVLDAARNFGTTFSSGELFFPGS